MSTFAKIVTGIFGKKSDRDMKIFIPFIEEINLSYSPLESLSDDKLKQRFQDIRDTFQEESTNFRKTFKAERLDEDLEESVYKFEQEFLDENMVEVFAIVKDSCRRLYGTEFTVMHQKMKWEMIPYDVQLVGVLFFTRVKFLR